MANLILPSLEIQNFRAFEHLRIERLGRVNLITGKNNVGKTSLLEALHLYAKDGAVRLLRELLRDRDELYSSTSAGNGKGPSSQFVDASGIRNLFHDYPSVPGMSGSILIGPAEDNKNTLALTVDWFQPVEQVDEDNEVTRKLVRVPQKDIGGNAEARPYIVVKAGNNPPVRRSLEKLSSGLLVGSDNSDIEFVRAHGLDIYKIAELWDDVALTPLEEDVTDALRIVVPDINRLSIMSEREDVHGPIPIVSLRGQQERVALKSLGDGINRLFGLALALVNVQNGMLLIDEVETGLHYSVMPDVWKLIFQVAQRLNVQVFATTHSWDCIEAFQKAAAEDQHEEALLIRLREKNGKVTTTIFDERDLAIVTREAIEVR